MTTLADIRAAVKTLLASVTDIGVVQDYERYAKARSEFKEFYVTGGKVHGWFFQRKSKKENRPYLGRVEVVNEWRIRGFMSLDDENESEKTFDNLIEAIFNKFKTDDTLGGIIDTMVVNNNMIMALLNSQPVMFSGVLCHSAELQFYTRHYE